jgi:hypothetical protein
MAKVIEFYIPKNCRKPHQWVSQPLPGVDLGRARP